MIFDFFSVSTFCICVHVDGWLITFLDQIYGSLALVICFSRFMKYLFHFRLSYVDFFSDDDDVDEQESKFCCWTEKNHHIFITKTYLVFLPIIIAKIIQNQSLSKRVVIVDVEKVFSISFKMQNSTKKKFRQSSNEVFTKSFSFF